MSRIEKYILIPTEFHGTIIGPSGGGVRRISEKYGVELQFPPRRRNNSSPSVPLSKSEQEEAERVLVKGQASNVDEAIAYLNTQIADVFSVAITAEILENSHDLSNWRRQLAEALKAKFKAQLFTDSQAKRYLKSIKDTAITKEDKQSLYIKAPREGLDNVKDFVMKELEELVSLQSFPIKVVSKFKCFIV